MTTPYPDSGTRRIITASAMVATLMVTLDGTIAAVALPHIQASVSASPEQVVWILTSYLIAEAIATPLSVWMATRFGRKTVMVISVVGFTPASAACGAASSLIGLVLFRALQGHSARLWCRCARLSFSTSIRRKSKGRRWPCTEWEQSPGQSSGRCLAVC